MPLPPADGWAESADPTFSGSMYPWKCDTTARRRKGSRYWLPSIIPYWFTEGHWRNTHIKILISQTNTENKYPCILLGQLCALQRDYIKFWFLRQMEGEKYFHSISSIQFVWERAFRWQCTLQPIIMWPLQFEHTPFVCKLHSLITRGSMPEATSVHIMCNFPLLICPTYQCNFQPSDP